MDKKWNIRNMSVIAHVDHGARREQGARARRRVARSSRAGTHTRSLPLSPLSPPSSINTSRQVDAHGLARRGGRHHGHGPGESRSSTVAGAGDPLSLPQPAIVLCFVCLSSLAMH